MPAPACLCLLHGYHPQGAPSQVWRVPAAGIVTRSIDWAGMALPLVACVAIWQLGDASAESAAWLPLLHRLVASAATAWTALRLVLRRRGALTLPSLPGALAHTAMLALYGFLGLQLVLALAGSMLHGQKTILFGIAVPSILPTNQLLARIVDDLHGWNAMLLLALIAVQIVTALRTLRRGGADPRFCREDG